MSMLRGGEVRSPAGRAGGGAQATPTHAIETPCELTQSLQKPKGVGWPRLGHCAWEVICGFGAVCLALEGHRLGCS